MNGNRAGLTVLLLWVSFGMAFGQNTQAEKQKFEATKAQADRGDAHAQFALGNLYFLGTGTRRDLIKAAKWHRKAAEQGLVQAQLRVAFDYLNGVGLKTDPIEATKWFHRAADQASAEAQFELGRSYAEGRGVGENPVEAAAWYRRAADQDFAAAQYELGNCYFEGEGVTKDTPEGVAWMKKAAEQGYAPAEDAYGTCFAKAKGVGQDYVEAYKWFSLAAAQGGEGSTQTKIDLSMAEHAMTPEQITAGQKLAREFHPHKAELLPGTVAQEDHQAGGASSGIVTIKAEDETAEVYVDGASVGNAPAKVNLAPGIHEIAVKKPGFKEYRKELKVTAGAELTVRAVLEKE
jgi:hypothetical protein